MQVDSKFSEAVAYLTAELRKLQLANPAWLDAISEATGIEGLISDSVSRAEQEFNGRTAVIDKFDLSDLNRTLQELITAQSENETLVSVGQIQAATTQVQFLLSLQRYYSRRKQTRIQRIIHAAHRRAILTHVQGPIARDLRRTVENFLLGSS